MTLALDPIDSIPFVLLLLAVLGLWIHRAVWMLALLASVGTGYLTGAVNDLAGLWLAILAALAWAYRQARERPRSGQAILMQWLFGLAFFVAAMAVALVLLPGFPRTTLVTETALTPDATPYGMGLGFSKVVTGILILGVINPERVRSAAELGRVLARALPVFVVTVSAVILLTLALGYVRFDPKWTPLFLVWAPVNLFFTCLAEEAFFRGFVQHELSRGGSGSRPIAVLALLVSAVLFGLVHFAGGWTYVLAGVVAGLGYGLAYSVTRRIEAAMAVHFALNATHFLLFTYPALR